MPRRSSFACSIRRASARRTAYRCPNTRTRSGTATCRTCAAASFTATACHGPYDPKNGHRFNPNKLVIDPYAKALHGDLRWHDAVFGYRFNQPAADLSRDRRDSARLMPKCVVIDTAYTWGEDRAPAPRLGRHRLLRSAREGDDRGARGYARADPRHFRRPRRSACHRPSGAARRHRDRTDAGAGFLRRPLSGREAARELLGLQHRSTISRSPRATSRTAPTCTSSR